MAVEQQPEPEIVYRPVGRDRIAVARIELNRPNKGNALTIPMIRRLESLAAEIESDRSVRAVVIRGRGRFFCTGGDIEAWGALSPQEMARDWILPGVAVLARIAALPQPVIAVISGHALGGGLELALAADLRIAIRSAKLGIPEVGLGMISGWGGLRRLAETIGVARARQMALLGSPITAAQALEWGLVNALAEDEADLERQLEGWLERISGNAPAATALTKGILATMHQDLRHHHAAAAAEAVASGESQEGVRAFLEKRKPVWL